MSWIKPRLFSAIILMLFTGLAVAQSPVGLNTISVLVPNRSSKILQQTLPKALAEELIKVSGNPGVATLPQIQDALTNVNELVQSYSYQWQNNNNNKQLYLKIIFDLKGIERLLQSANQAIWRHRPLVLVWLKVNDIKNSYLLSNSMQNDIKSALQQNTNHRGVPYLLPTMDLQDQAFVDTNPKQTFDIKNLQAAAKRYGVTIILAGNITHAANNAWQGQWLLLLNDEPLRWTNAADNSTMLFQSTINTAANMLANRFAVIDNKNMQSNIMMSVAGIDDLADYAKVIKYLRRLAQVTKVSIADTNGSNLLLQVTCVGGLLQLQKALAHSPKLIALTETDNELSNVDLFYRWVTTDKHEATLSSAPQALAIPQQQPVKLPLPESH